MAEHSSISSSDGDPATEIGYGTEISHTLGAIDTDPRAKGPVFVEPDHVPHRDRTRIPWAFIFSLVILLGVEVWLRASHWPKKIPYALELDEYHAVKLSLARDGPAQVAIVGSSRARESIDVPELRNILRKSMGKKVSVANYAVGGGRAPAIDAITKTILRSKHPPRVIILGGAELDLGYGGQPYDQPPLFWTFKDWREDYHRRGYEVLGDLPTVVRSYLGRLYWTLGLREQMNLRLRQIALGEHDEPSQIDGEYTPWQRTEADRNLINRMPKKKWFLDYVPTLAHGLYPNRDFCDYMTELCQACQQKHVRLIVYQVPIPNILRKFVRTNLEESYIKTISRICKENGATFITPKQMKVDLTKADFRDPSHLNRYGAEKVTTVLGEKFIAPTLKAAESHPTTKPSKKKAKKPKHPTPAATQPTTTK